MNDDLHDLVHDAVDDEIDTLWSRVMALARHAGIDMPVPKNRPRSIVDERRLTALEQRVAALEAKLVEVLRAVNPGIRARAANVIFWSLLFLTLYSWAIKEVRDYYLDNLATAVVVTSSMIGLALLIRWLPDDD